MPGYEPSCAQASASWERIVDELTAQAPIVKSSMFGMPTLRHDGGKAFAGLRGDTMTFKLTGETHARALTLDGARPFDPAGGRPMKQWVQVPVVHCDAWLELAWAAARTDG